MNEKLWYDYESKYWCDALPLGNGRIGAMVYSGIDREQIGLNEDTLWSGTPKDNVEKNRHPYYKEARDLALNGEYEKAQAIIEDNITGEYTESYMPLGDIFLDMKYDSDKKATNYRRELCLKTAVTTLSYEKDGVNFERETFTSNPDEILCMHLKASKNVLSFDLSMDSQLRFDTVVSEDFYELRGLCPSHAVPVYVHDVVGLDGIIYNEGDENVGIRFNAVCSIKTDGEKFVENSKLCVRNASFAKVVFAVRSNFAGFDKFPEIEKIEYIEKAKNDAKKAIDKSFDTLKDCHISDYSALYNTFSFNPEINSLDADTFTRITKYREDRSDDGIVLLLLNYGRYLMIASSREGTKATHLQALWNNLLRAPWSSNYTLNINLPMNYWATSALGLHSLHSPFNELLENLSVVGESVAKEYYDASGFAVHHNTDIWARANPVGKRRFKGSAHDFWPLAGAWLVRHLYSQYEYTKDEVFLKEKAYPLMKKAADFILDVLVTDKNGERIFAPSTSPENNFLIDGEFYAVSKTTTMTTSIIKDLFENLIKTLEILDTQSDLVARLKDELLKLPSIKIGSDNRILEWSEELPEWDMVHRHISHLYALYPAKDITPEKTLDLAKASANSLNARSDEGTGWSRAWKVCLWARLYDAERAYELLQGQLNLIPSSKTETEFTGGGTYPNLLGAHPPFQIDGNFGVLAGLVEMLFQYKDDVLYIFKALPDAWKTGKLEGLHTENALVLDIIWEDKKITSLVIKSALAQEINAEINGEIKKLTLAKGENKII